MKGHAHIGAFGLTLGAERVGEELAAYGGVPAALLHGLQHGVNGAGVDGALHEQGRHPPLDHERRHAADVGHGGLGLGADALDAHHLDVVGAPEVRERVVGGDENSLP
mgnify:CR=1 FL=1